MGFLLISISMCVKERYQIMYLKVVSQIDSFCHGCLRDFSLLYIGMVITIQLKFKKTCVYWRGEGGGVMIKENGGI